MAETLLLRGIPGTAWLSLWYTLYRRGGHWPTAFLVLYKQLISLPEGGKFLLSAVYASCFGNYFSAHFAVPHPSRLRRATFPPGEGLRRAAAGNGGMSREKGLHQRKRIAHQSADWFAMTVEIWRLPQKRYRARQGSYDHRRTGARIVSGHWPPIPSGRRAGTNTAAPAHALAARPAGKEITLNDHHLTTVIR